MTGEEGEAVPKSESSRSERRKAQLAQWREKFVQNLEGAGLLMEKVLKIRLNTVHLFNETYSYSLLLLAHEPPSLLSLFPFRRRQQMKRRQYIS